MVKNNGNIPPITWRWEEGRYWDLWMLVHFLSGGILGFAAYLIALSFWPAFLTAVSLMILFELFEKKGIGVDETPENSTLDVVVGIPGFLGFFLAVPALVGPEAVLSVGITITAINVVLAFYGWRDYVLERYEERDTVLVRIKEQLAEKRRKMREKMKKRKMKRG